LKLNGVDDIIDLKRIRVNKKKNELVFMKTDGYTCRVTFKKKKVNAPPKMKKKNVFTALAIDPGSVIPITGVQAIITKDNSIYIQ
jgi:hypothetical protein